MINSYPKIFAIGTDYIKDIFHDEEISEKIDGSQFAFGCINGNVYMRSKGVQLYMDNPEPMFKKAMEYVTDIKDNLKEGLIYYTEYLKTPKHNFNHFI